MHDRQTVVFGVILSTLAVAAMIGVAVYTDAVRMPFLERAFSTEDPVLTNPIPCVDSGMLPVNPPDISVTVVNGTTKGGLAGQAGQQLAEMYGFTVGEPANAGENLDGTAKIVFGATAIAQAYTLQLYVPGSTLDYDKSRTDNTVDLILGAEFAEIPDDVVPDAEAPLASVDGCVPLSSATAPPP